MRSLFTYFTGCLKAVSQFNGLVEIFSSVDEHHEGIISTFFNETLPHLLELIRDMPSIFPEPLKLLKRGTRCTATLNEEQVLVLVASGFLCLLPPPLTEKFTSLNFRKFFRSATECQTTKLLCILTYFNSAIAQRVSHFNTINDNKERAIKREQYETELQKYQQEAALSAANKKKTAQDAPLSVPDINLEEVQELPVPPALSSLLVRLERRVLSNSNAMMPSAENFWETCSAPMSLLSIACSKSEISEAQDENPCRQFMLTTATMGGVDLFKSSWGSNDFDCRTLLSFPSTMACLALCEKIAFPEETLVVFGARRIVDVVGIGASMQFVGPAIDKMPLIPSPFSDSSYKTVAREICLTIPGSYSRSPNIQLNPTSILTELNNLFFSLKDNIGRAATKDLVECLTVGEELKKMVEAQADAWRSAQSYRKRLTQKKERQNKELLLPQQVNDVVNDNIIASNAGNAIKEMDIDNEKMKPVNGNGAILNNSGPITGVSDHSAFNHLDVAEEDHSSWEHEEEIPRLGLSNNILEDADDIYFPHFGNIKAVNKLRNLEHILSGYYLNNTSNEIETQLTSNPSSVSSFAVDESFVGLEKNMGVQVINNLHPSAESLCNNIEMLLEAASDVPASVFKSWMTNKMQMDTAFLLSSKLLSKLPKESLKELNFTDKFNNQDSNPDEEKDTTPVKSASQILSSFILTQSTNKPASSPSTNSAVDLKKNDFNFKVTGLPTGLESPFGGHPMLRIILTWLAASASGRDYTVCLKDLYGLEPIGLKETPGALIGGTERVNQLTMLSELFQTKRVTVGHVFGMLLDSLLLLKDHGVEITDSMLSTLKYGI